MSDGRSALHRQGLAEGRRPDGSAVHAPQPPACTPIRVVPEADDLHRVLGDLMLDGVAELLDALADELAAQREPIPPVVIARHLRRVAQGLRSQHTNTEAPSHGTQH